MVVVVDGGGGDGDTVNLKLPGPLPGLLLEVHLLDVLLGHGPFPLHGRPHHILLLVLLKKARMSSIKMSRGNSLLVSGTGILQNKYLKKLPVP